MSRCIWLLVEWVDERNVFPSYGVVNVDTLAYDESDINIGKEIFIRVKHESPRRAQILRISDSKRYLKEHKDILERQDQKVKNVLQLCMRTIKEMKKEPVYISPLGEQHNIPGGHKTLPRIVKANSDNSDSDSEPETSGQPDRVRIQQLNKNVKYMHNLEPNIHHNRSAYNNTTNRRSIITSTPLPSSSQEKTLLCFDQGTQTDNAALQPSIDKIEELEGELKSLFDKFESLAGQVNVSTDETVYVSDTEQNDGDNNIPVIEPRVDELWMGRNSVQHVDPEPINHENIDEVRAEQIVGGAVVEQLINSSNMKVETEKEAASVVRVRRMSAQTTNNIEVAYPNYFDMVPIGVGNAVVPARVMTDIDWSSHTTATRQLLQAIFPRRILATHSLTGKRSPAFMDKPPKKLLDPKLVDDIVVTVASRCGVPKNLVRNSITIKCTDEAKLYRNRQYRRANQASRQNEENVPPSTLSSDESSTVTN